MINEVQAIRKLFRPIQPSVKLGDSLISYNEFKPSNVLGDYIYCYWQLKTNRSLGQPFSYRVVSDGCIDIFFESENPEKSFVMGFCRKFTEFSLDTDFNYIGVRFLPSFFPLFFKVDAKVLTNKFQELSRVAPQFSSWLATFESEKSFVEVLNSKFESILQNFSSVDIDGRFYTAVSEILKRNGNIDLEKEMLAGISSRQLRRKFNQYLGTTPKAFANVVRFQHILNAKPSKQSLKENKIYFDVGFYDQAHFIKSFKSFYGVTPSVAFD